MKKIYTYICIAFLLFGAFGVDATFAQPTTFSDGATQIQNNLTSISNPAGAALAGAKMAWSAFGLGNIIFSILGWIGYFILQLMALLLGITGILLNFVLDKTIIDFSDNIRTFTGINVVWKTIRDLVNMSFIFILVYQGILMIVSKGDDVKVRRFIFAIILSSILINFSLFFTKIVIDASNIVTISIYNRIVSADPEAEDYLFKYGLSNIYIQSLGLQGFWGENAVESVSGLDALAGGDQRTGGKLFTISLMGSLLFLITSFTFLAISAMLIVRYIVLIILLATSPIGFMKGLFPYIDKKSSEWWESLIGQAVFPAVFMLMTWIILTLISPENGFTNDLDHKKWLELVNPQQDISSTALANASASGNNGPLSLLFNFSVVIGLSIASILVAKNYATQGAKAISGLINNATSIAGNTVLGGAARLGRNTLGVAGNRISESSWLKDKAVNGGTFGKWASMKALQGGDKIAQSSFDVRSSTIGKNFAKQSTVDFGENTNKGGRRGDVKQYGEKEAAKANLLKVSDVEIEAANQILNSKTFKDKEIEEFNKTDIGKKYYAVEAEWNESKAERERLENIVKTQEKERRSLSSTIDTLKIPDIDKLKTDKSALEAKNDPSLADEIQKITDKIAQAEKDKQKKAELITKRDELKNSLKESRDDLKSFVDQHRETKAKFDEVSAEKESWMSAEKEALIAKIGGQDKKEKNDMLVQRKVIGVSQNRVDAYANRIEDAGLAKRWGVHVKDQITSFGIPNLPIIQAINETPITKRDRMMIGKTVRATAKVKKDGDKA